MKKWLVGLMCVGMWTATAMGQLIISQYTETDSGTTPKGIEIWNPTASDITFDATSNLLDVKVGANGATPVSSVTVSSGTLVAGDVWVIGTSGMSPDTVKAFTFNGNDSIVLELGGVVQDVIGTPGVDPVTAWTSNGVSTANQNIQLKIGITNGETVGWTDPSLRFEYVSVGSVLTGFGVPPGGAAPFSVALNRTNNFKVVEGVSDAITATAADGTEPYGYAWSSTLGATDYTAVENVFTILATAPAGSYSATVVASDATAKSVTNTVNFSIVSPFAITITPPVNGTVSTTPETEALAGTTITITATAADGYRVASMSVVDGASNPVVVSGNSFVMPSSAVTVTVLFEVYVTPDILLNFETNTTLSSGAYAPGTSTVNSVNFTHENCLRGGLAGDTKNGLYAGRLRYNTLTNGSFRNTFAFEQPISKINFFYANYGTDNSVTFKLQVSENGTDWTDLGSVYDPATNILVESVIDGGIPANSVYLQFITVSGTDGQRVNIDDIGIYLGTPTPTLTYTGSTTGTVGQAMSLVFTLHDATASGWEYTLRNADRSQVVTNGSSFTFNWTPPSTGAFHLEMTALDPTNGVLATTEVSLTVNGSVVNPDIPPISIEGGNLTFVVPDGFTLVRLEGALPSQLSANTWTTLVLDTDYIVEGTKVIISTDENEGRMIRIVLLPVPLG